MTPNSSETSETLFSVSDIKANVKVHTIKSSKASLLGQAIKFGLHILLIAVLARFINPDDYGIFAIVAIYTGLGMAILDGGLSMATIQKDTITHQQVSNLFWFNTITGFFLTVILVLASPFIADYFDEPELIPVLSVIAFVFLLSGSSVQHDAILRRQMRFGDIVKIDLISFLIGSVISISLALNGWGYWALVSSYLSTAFIKTVLNWKYTKWRPSYLKRNVGTRPLVFFGLKLAGSSFLNFFSLNITPFAIGSIAGASFLGLYNRTFALASIPTTQAFPPLLNVLRPALSRVSDDPVRLRIVGMSLLTKVCMLTTFISSFIFLTADGIILIMLGENWNNAVPILKIVSMTTLLSPVGSLTATILIASGAGGALLIWQFLNVLLLSLTIFTGSLWGAYGVLYSVMIYVIFIHIPVFFFYAAKFQPIRFYDFLRSVYLPLISGILTVVLILSSKEIISFDTWISEFIFICISVTILYFTFLFSANSTRNQLFELRDIIKKK